MKRKKSKLYEPEISPTMGLTLIFCLLLSAVTGIFYGIGWYGINDSIKKSEAIYRTDADARCPNDFLTEMYQYEPASGKSHDDRHEIVIMHYKPDKSKNLIQKALYAIQEGHPAQAADILQKIIDHE